MQMDDGKITFENIFVTPLERWVDANIDLDPVAVERLNRLAALSNQSVDNVLNHILEDFFAEHLELSELNAAAPPFAKNQSQIVTCLLRRPALWGNWNKKKHAVIQPRVFHFRQTVGCPLQLHAALNLCVEPLQLLSVKRVGLAFEDGAEGFHFFAGKGDGAVHVVFKRGYGHRANFAD